MTPGESNYGLQDAGEDGCPFCGSHEAGHFYSRWGGCSPAQFLLNDDDIAYLTAMGIPVDKRF